MSSPRPSQSSTAVVDMAQRLRDEAVGRALRETERVVPDAPRVHVSWESDGRTYGQMLVDHPLYNERAALAHAAGELYEAAAEYTGQEAL